ncbi:hypothetical protein F7734_10460 [Scytonema sp. UIC 10036]|uniref:hypothetical protein n=1 Tax=Scytonema sp. UIC 10036 TaxID=2304196 RepID=UPI0012DA59B1|nr:hypothetical protein [Scytonema sp. UIC 10036]MUG92848.1 hypothetical protein [Scytonema sp. UIC 10036]
MDREQYLEQQNKKLLAIATEAKRLLLSEEISDATPEVMNLVEAIEQYEANYCEIEPMSGKPWYASYKQAG